jgi:hypothetical protein
VTTLTEYARLTEAVDPTAVTYLLTVTPDGRASVDRVHPDGGVSGDSYGVMTEEAMVLTEVVRRFRAGSSYDGEW